MTLATGSTLGRYQIVAHLGQGGMATVYKAFQPALDRFVALKVLRAGIMEDPEQRERFEREAKAIARLRHPNIVQVFDFDTVEGNAFLVIEYIEGGTLKSRLQELARANQKLPRGEAERIIKEVAEALDTAHQQGIVHRDVKPSNVLLSRAGRAVMADFGIARMLAATQHTQTGVGVGTPEYMSPEQGEGKDIDHRSDIYALGVMAYELLLGRVPFQADTPLAVVLAHVRDPLPLPTSIDPTIGSAVERVLLKAMAKDPAQRYASAGEFSAALAKAIATPDVAPAAAPAAATPTAATPAPPAPAPAAAPVLPPRPPKARKPAIDLTRTARATIRWQIGLVSRLVGILFLILEVLLVARIGLSVLPQQAGAAAFVRAITDPFAAPFDGIADGLLAQVVPDPSKLPPVDFAGILALIALFAVSRIVDAGFGIVLKRFTSSPY